jgi:hypothetical protein
MPRSDGDRKIDAAVLLIPGVAMVDDCAGGLNVADHPAVPRYAGTCLIGSEQKSFENLTMRSARRSGSRTCFLPTQRFELDGPYVDVPGSGRLSSSCTGTPVHSRRADCQCARRIVSSTPDTSPRNCWACSRLGINGSIGVG